MFRSKLLKRQSNLLKRSSLRSILSKAHHRLPRRAYYTYPILIVPFKFVVPFIRIKAVRRRRPAEDVLKCWRSRCVSGRGEGERTAPNRRGPDKQKRKRAPATSKQNAKTQKKRHDNKLATAAELLVLMLSASEGLTKEISKILAREQWMPPPPPPPTTTTTTERRMASVTRLEPAPIATKYLWKQLKMTTATSAWLREAVRQTRRDRA